MERVFGTLQPLAPLLRLYRITTITAANRFLGEVYTPTALSAWRCLPDGGSLQGFHQTLIAASGSHPRSSSTRSGSITASA